MPASAGQACRIKEISSAFPFPPSPVSSTKWAQNPQAGCPFHVRVGSAPMSASWNWGADWGYLGSLKSRHN